MDEPVLFAFESDFVETLRCIPMAVRLKLDRCLIKLSLRQWSRLSHEQRGDCLRRPCRTSEEIESYSAALSEHVTVAFGDELVRLPAISEASSARPPSSAMHSP